MFTVSWVPVCVICYLETLVMLHKPCTTDTCIGGPVFTEVVLQWQGTLH